MNAVAPETATAAASGIRLAARLVLAQLANAAGFVSEAVRARAGRQTSSRVP